MTSRFPSLPTAWAVAVLPVACAAVCCLAFFPSEAATEVFFSAWRAGHPQAAHWIGVFSDWSNPALYFVYAGILWRGLRARSRTDTAFVLAYVAAQLLVSVAVVRIFKIGFGRPRPDVGGDWRPMSLDNAHNSLPSGHTSEMTLQTLVLAGRQRALAPVWGLYLGLLGASRIVLGAHHPSDVLAGLVVGAFGAALARRLAPRIAARLPQRWRN